MLRKNTLWNLVGQGAPLLAALFTVPVLIHGLGPERFGVLTLIWMVVGYFSIFDLGLGRALTQLLAEKLGTGDHRDVPVLTWTALALMGALGVVGALAAAAATPALGAALKVPAALARETRGALYVLALSIPIVVGTAGVRGVLEARQRFDLVNLVRLGSGLFTYVGPAAALLFTRSLVPITAVLVAGRAATWLLYLVLTLRELPDLRAGLRVDRAFVRPLLRFGGWMTVSNVVGPVLVYLDRFVIAGVAGAAAVGYYVTPFEVVARLLMLPIALAGALFPLIASTFAADRPQAAALFSRGTRYVFLSLFPVTLLLAVFAREGLTLWLGAGFAAQATLVLRWLALGVFLNGLVQVPFATLQAMGRPDLAARAHLAELPPYLLALWWMTQRWGIEGAAAAWTLRALLDGAIQFAMVLRLLPGPARARVRGPALAAAAAAASFGVAALVGGHTGRALAFTAVVLPAFAVLAWAYLLEPAERTRLVRLVERPLGRRAAVAGPRAMGGEP